MNERITICHFMHDQVVFLFINESRLDLLNKIKPTHMFTYCENVKNNIKSIAQKFKLLYFN
jgi:hypothetical protein